MKNYVIYQNPDSMDYSAKEITEVQSWNARSTCAECDRREAEADEREY